MADDPYWQLDTSLFEGTFRYFGEDSPVLVRGKVHTERERYSKGDVAQEVTSVSITSGTRIYVHIRPIVLIPSILVAVILENEPQPGGPIGGVAAAREDPKPKEVEVGNVQAWSYPDNTLVLWECYLDHFVRREGRLQDDQNMVAFWRSVEAFLLTQFPHTERIVTTSHDPMFETDEYQAMLAALGYAPVAKAAWGRAIERTE